MTEEQPVDPSSASPYWLKPRRADRRRPPKKPVKDGELATWRPWAHRFVLLAGAIAYYYVCRTAIFRRGFPSIDPWYLGLTWTWFVPAAIAAVFDDRFRRRWPELLVYSLLTGYIDAGSVVSVVPHRPNLVRMIPRAIFLMGPLHVAVTALTFGVTRYVLRLSAKLRSGDGRRAWTLSAVKALCVLLALATGVLVPFGYREAAYWDTARRAAAQAQSDWKEGQAVWYVLRTDPEFRESRLGDRNLMPGWGLPMRGVFGGGPVADTYARAYRKRIRELMARDGKPEVVSQLLTAAEIKALIARGGFSREDTTPSAYTTPGGSDDWRARVREKGNVLVIVDGNEIRVVSPEGEHLQFMLCDQHEIDTGSLEASGEKRKKQ